MEIENEKFEGLLKSLYEGKVHNGSFIDKQWVGYPLDEMEYNEFEYKFRIDIRGVSNDKVYVNIIVDEVTKNGKDYYDKLVNPVYMDHYYVEIIQLFKKTIQDDCFKYFPILFDLVIYGHDEETLQRNI
jgi:hypothetical protein